MVRRITGWGETSLEPYRERILGLQGQPLPKSWGFDEPASTRETEAGAGAERGGQREAERGTQREAERGSQREAERGTQREAERGTQRELDG